MRRVFWIALGATAGVLIVRKVTRTAEKFTPAGMSASLSASLGDLGASISDFAAEVRAGMAEREQDLRDQLGLDGRADDTPAPPDGAR